MCPKWCNHTLASWVLAFICKGRPAPSPKAESLPWTVYQISTGFFCPKTWICSRVDFAVAVMGNHLLTATPAWAPHLLRWFGYYGILVLKTTTDSQAIKTSSATVHKELEITVLKNRLFLPPLQHLPHSPSLPLKRISETPNLLCHTPSQQFCSPVSGKRHSDHKDSRRGQELENAEEQNTAHSFPCSPSLGDV